MNHVVSSSNNFIHLAITYCYVLFSSLIELAVFHLVVRITIAFTFTQYAIIKYNYVSMALILSSFSKLLLILMIIWDYNEIQYTWVVGLYALASNVEALTAFLDTSYLTSAFIIAFGVFAKIIVQRFLLPELTHVLL